jgi:hypothetical protein
MGTLENRSTLAKNQGLVVPETLRFKFLGLLPRHLTPICLATAEVLLGRHICRHPETRRFKTRLRNGLLGDPKPVSYGR